MSPRDNREEGPSASSGRRRGGGALREAIDEAERSKEARLTPQQAEHVVAFLADKWGHRPCPYCATEDWAVGEKYLGLPTLGPSRPIPLGQVSCKNCGNTVLISAEWADVWPGEIHR